MIHFLEIRDEESKKLDEQLKEEKKSHQPSAIRHPTSDILHLEAHPTSDIRRLSTLDSRLSTNIYN